MKLFSTLFAGLQNRLAALLPSPRPAYWDDEIALTLGEIARETETKASGRVQTISLASFRESIGPLWEDYKERILLIAETTIGRRIGRGNTYIAQEDDSWLLLFPGAKENEAQARADAIAATIGEKLIGARFATEESPLPRTARLDLETAVGADGVVDLEAVRAAVSKVRMAQIKRKVTSPPKATGAKPASTPAEARARTPMRDMTIRYRAAWTAETQSIDTFHFRAASGGIDLLEDNGLSAAIALDVVRAGVDAFTAMRATRLRAKFVLPVPVGVLDARALSEAHRLITALPRDDRLLCLRVELCRLPRVTPEQLVALRELFRAHVREVAVPIDAFFANDPVLALDHIVLAADVAHEAGCSDDAFFQAMVLFKTRAGSRITSVQGLRRRSHLARAINAGIAEVGGPALGDDLRELPLRTEVLRPGAVAS